MPPASDTDRIATFAKNIWGVDDAVARANVMMGSVGECQDTVARYRRAGITHVIFLLMPPFDLEAVQTFAEDVVPGLR